MSRSKYYHDDSPNNYVTPPTTPEMELMTTSHKKSSSNKVDTPINVTVVTTEHHTVRSYNNNPNNTSNDYGVEDQSVSGSLISDLTGSIVPHPQKSSPQHNKRHYNHNSETKEQPEDDDYNNTDSNDDGTQTDSNKLNNNYDCTKATSGLVEDFFVMMNCNKEEEKLKQTSRKQLSSKTTRVVTPTNDNDDTNNNTNVMMSGVTFVPNMECGKGYRDSTTSTTKPEKEWRPPVWGQAPTMEDDTTAFASRELEGQQQEANNRPSAVGGTNVVPRSLSPGDVSSKKHDNFELVLKRGQSQPQSRGQPQQQSPQMSNQSVTGVSSKNVGMGWKRHYQSRNEHHAMMQRAVMGIYSDIDSTVAEEEAAKSRAKEAKLQQEEKAKEAKYKAIFGVDPDPKSSSKAAPSSLPVLATQEEKKEEEQYGIDEGFELQHDEEQDTKNLSSRKEDKTQKKNWFAKKLIKRTSQNNKQESSSSNFLSKSMNSDHKYADRYGNTATAAAASSEQRSADDHNHHRIIEPVYAPPIEPASAVVVLPVPTSTTTNSLPDKKEVIAPPTPKPTSSSVGVARSVPASPKRTPSPAPSGGGGSFLAAPNTPTRSKSPSPVVCEERTASGQRVVVTAEGPSVQSNYSEDMGDDDEADNNTRNHKITVTEQDPQPVQPASDGKKKKKFFFIPRPSKNNNKQANTTAAAAATPNNDRAIKSKNSFTGSEQAQGVSVRSSTNPVRNSSWTKKASQQQQAPPPPQDDAEQAPPSSNNSTTARNRSWNLGGKKQQQEDEENKQEQAPTPSSNSTTGTNTPGRRSITSPFKSSRSVASDASSVKPPVKPEWKGTLDSSTGKTYYYHRMSRTTTWSKPPGYDEEQAAYAEAKRESKMRKKKRKERKLQKQQQKQQKEQQEQSKNNTTTNNKENDEYNTHDVSLRSPSTTSLGSSAFSPIDNKKNTTSHNDAQPESPGRKSVAESEEPSSFLDDSSDLQNYLPGRVATGNTGRSVSSRQRSHYTAQTDTTETTQQIRNTGSRLHRVFESIPEAVDHNTSGSISSFVDDSQAGESSTNSPGKGYGTTISRRTGGGLTSRRRTANRGPTRERELRVEEFDSGTRFSNKRFGLKTEVYDRSGVSRVGRPVSPASVHTEDILSKDGDGANDTSTEIDLHGYDSVSELGHSEAEFTSRRDQFEMSQRKALDEAIKNNDWELAASVADGLKHETSFEPSATRKGRSKPENQEWTQNEVDKFISQNDWDAVSQYIAKMRDTVVNGLSGSAHETGPSNRYSNKNSNSSKNAQSQGGAIPLKERSNDIHRNAGSNASAAQKHFGARSQLQHHDEIVSTTSSWDSVYRTSSDESEYLSSDDESFNVGKSRNDTRRMAT